MGLDPKEKYIPIPDRNSLGLGSPVLRIPSPYDPIRGLQNKVGTPHIDGVTSAHWILTRFWRQFNTNPSGTAEMVKGVLSVEEASLATVLRSIQELSRSSEENIGNFLPCPDPSCEESYLATMLKKQKIAPDADPAWQTLWTDMIKTVWDTSTVEARHAELVERTRPSLKETGLDLELVLEGVSAQEKITRQVLHMLAHCLDGVRDKITWKLWEEEDDQDRTEGENLRVAGQEFYIEVVCES